MAAPSPLSDELKKAIDGYVQSDVLIDDEREATLKIVVEALDKEDAKLLDVVLYLGKALNDPDSPKVRRLAVQLLVECLRGAQLKLNFKHAETLARFFASKLSDWQCVEGALGGLLLMLQRHGVLMRGLKGGADDGEEALVTQLARRVFKDVSTPSHTQQVRKAALDVVHELLEAWPEELAALGPQLGEGVGSTIEEERDPRNLLLAFTIAGRLLGGFDAACVSEEALQALFETLTSYFPITFQPPKDDKHGITGEHLRGALNRALGASRRYAPLLVPFALDNTKDVAVDDSEDTIRQALEMLGACLEAYGPEVARSHVRAVLATARDQVCRTTTPCTAEFCTAARRALAVALRDVPAGLTPHWLGRDVDPALKSFAADAAQGGSVLASGGSRKLLLALAGAHPLLLQRIWALSLPALFAQQQGGGGGEGAASQEKPPEVLPLESVGFVAELAQLAEGPSGKKPLLAVRQMKPALAGALAALRGLRAQGESGTSGESREAAAAAAVSLLGRLCRLVGEEASGDGFRCLSLLLLPPAGGGASGELEAWAAEWRRALAAAPPSDPLLEALVGAVGSVVLEQPARAADLGSALLAPGAEQAMPSLPAALPRLLVSAAVSLARLAAGPETAESAEGESAKPDGKAARGTARELLLRAASLATPSGGAAWKSEALAAVAESLEAAQVPPAAAAWAASRLVEALALPSELPRLCCGVEGGGGDLGSGCAAAARGLVRALSGKLPQEEASALRRQVLESASGPATAGVQACVVLVPAVLPAAAQEAWGLCEGVLTAISRCAPEQGHEGQEAVALEALQALVEACPQAELEARLQGFRGAFGGLLQGGASGAAEPSRARCAVRCWAAVAGALLRRGGCAAQAAAFLETLLGALEGGAPALQHVPEAFRTLMPPAFAAGGAAAGAAAGAAPLPPLALQQLSLTMLPSLVARTRAAAGASGAEAARGQRAALESAVALLCALPAEALCSDCGDELRWCTLTGLSRLREDAECGEVAPGGADVFAAQVLQLLLRASSHGAAWIEDELHTVVSFVAGPGTTHAVPLVRLGSLQALFQLVQRSRGHLAPFRKLIEEATRKGIEDRRREVRLVAVACLNAWHCGKALDS